MYNSRHKKVQIDNNKNDLYDLYEFCIINSFSII